MSGARRIIQINEKFPAGRKSGLLNASGMAMLQGKNPARPAAGNVIAKMINFSCLANGILGALERGIRKEA